MKSLATTKMESYNNTINIKFFDAFIKITSYCECDFSNINWNFDSDNMKLERQMNSVCSMITRSENATLQDSNIIELNLSRDCDKQECQDVFSMKQNYFHLQSEA